MQSMRTVVNAIVRNSSGKLGGQVRCGSAVCGSSGADLRRRGYRRDRRDRSVDYDGRSSHSARTCVGRHHRCVRCNHDARHVRTGPSHSPALLHWRVKSRIIRRVRSPRLIGLGLTIVAGTAATWVATALPDTRWALLAVPFLVTLFPAVQQFVKPWLVVLTMQTLKESDGHAGRDCDSCRAWRMNWPRMRGYGQ